MSLKGKKLKRRDFIRLSAAAMATVPLAGFDRLQRVEIGSVHNKSLSSKIKKATVALIKTKDRKDGVTKSFDLLTITSFKGTPIFIKPNFNTSDPAPGSTHNDTLIAIINEVRKRQAGPITLGERSGPPPTAKVMQEKGIFDLAKELDFQVINFEELAEEDWVWFKPEGIHWSEGFAIPKVVVEAPYIISTCCLKTHGFGGIFTMSLKLAVGLTPKRLMRELHRSPDMRRMIAEINLGYKPQLIILDGVEAFVNGGPSTGQRVQADIFIAGTDRVAVDMVGLAVLKELGSNEAIMGKKITEQEQIARAIELGLGISEPRSIELITPNEESRLYAEKIKSILEQG
ncbi:MAG: DUF362 domain-containing protein [Candidatus Aminicenantes bacterium]|nr:DUF362 domain-containing protein [Candidatus Aminicenantes bacterium]